MPATIVRKVSGKWTHAEESSVPRFVGVGTRFAKIAKYLDVIGSRKRCNCKRLKRLLDRKSPMWIDNNRDRVAAAIDKSARKRGVAVPGQRAVITQALRLVTSAASKESYTIVWVYWHAGAAGDELRYSMRSAYEHLADASDVVICGDRPPWFDGRVIESPRLSRHAARRDFGSTRFRKWIDSAIKLNAIVECGDVSDNFLWLYDDTFVWQPTTVRELSIPRYRGILHSDDIDTPKNHAWREVMRRTAKSLRSRGMMEYNFSTHYPVVFNKSRLQQTLDKFNCTKTARVIESLYLNQWHGQGAVRLNGELHYSKRPMRFKNWTPRNTALVVNVGGFNAAAKDAIIPRFPRVAPWEAMP